MSKHVRRLLESFIPEHYKLELQPDRTAMRFRGTVTIRGKRIGRPSKRLTFHQNGLKITQAQVIRQDKKGAQQIIISRINNQNSLHEVRLHTDSLIYSGSYTVTLAFEAPITKGMTGLYPCFFEYEGEEHTMLATQFESHHAREVFPCIDEPAAKATFDLALVHDSSLTALGNTPIRSQLSEGDKTTTIFETSPKMSTYLLAFVLGEIHNIAGKTKSGVAVNIWGTVAQPKDSFAFALDAAIRSIEYFEDYFGVPYPLPKADHIALPDFSSGAMENWGLITYREAVLLLYPGEESQSTRETIATVVAHETAHQWFGNLVTMRWWDDLWLNESFANMMEYAAVDAMFPDWHIWNTFIASEGLSALRRDATPGVQAVRTSVHHPDEISSLFDPSIVYAKGGRLLYMLKNYLGEDAWRAGLSAYFKKHAYGNTTGNDLWAALSAASGQDVSAFMTPWLEQSGFPVVSVSQSNAVDTGVVISQEHFLDTLEKADERLWPVPLFSDLTEPILTKNHGVWQAKQFVQINQGAKGHYIVHYTEKEHLAAITNLVKAGKLPVPDRLMLLSDSAMLARAGLQSFSQTLGLLEAYRSEATEAVWDIMSLVIADARRFVDVDEILEAPLKAYARELVAAEYERLGWEERPDESAEEQKLRATIVGLACYAELPAATKQATAYFEQYKSDSSVVSAELRGIVFATAVKLGLPGALDYLLGLYKTANSDLQRDIAGGITAVRTSKEAEQLLALVKDDKFVKAQDADRWVFMLLRNRYVKKIAWDWMEANWDWIEETYRQDKSYDYFPRIAASSVSTEVESKRYDAFFTPKESVPILARNIAIGREEIAARLAWLTRDTKAVTSFFQQ